MNDETECYQTGSQSPLVAMKDKMNIPQKDPWIHRNDSMHCATCIWFVSKEVGRIGRCRRHAPSMSGYPVVYLNDWCGDHKLDETKQ